MAAPGLHWIMSIDSVTRKMSMEVTSPSGKLHAITHLRDESTRDGNLWSVRTVCSCGFRGSAHSAYNDDQMTRVNSDAQRHLDAMKDWRGQPEPLYTPDGNLIHQSTD